jgi:phosphate transport system ATP-binding protein
MSVVHLPAGLRAWIRASQALRVSEYCAFFLAEEGAPGSVVEQGMTGTLFDSPVDPRTADYVHGRFG